VFEEKRGRRHTRIVGDKEADIGTSQNCSNPNQTRAASGDNGDVLPGVLAGLVFAVHHVVQMGDGFSQGLDTSGWPVLAAVQADVDGLGSGEAALDIVLYLGGSLAQICPFIGFLEKAMLSRSLGAPNDSGRGPSSI
jgi:hypothetical protein